MDIAIVISYFVCFMFLAMAGLCGLLHLAVGFVILAVLTALAVLIFFILITIDILRS